MSLYIYPPQGTTTVDIAPGADFATETTLALIETAVDGLETLVAATNTKLDTANGYIDGIETLVASTNTKLDTLAGYVDGIETLIGTTNTNTANINTQLTNKLSGSLVNVQYDNFEVAYNSLTDVYTYKLAAATVKTVTITYTGTDKQTISTVAAV
jgi:ABC-type sulfate transport system substrate-binding protein